MEASANSASSLVVVIATVCIIWYIFIILVQLIGTTQLYRHYTHIPPPATIPTLPTSQIPHITIIRPISGLDPNLYACLSSTFHQSYPKTHTHISFCISSHTSEALPLLRRLIAQHPSHNARIYIESDDPNLSGSSDTLGPNPKIRNMNRAYEEAESDILWVLDCNVWVGEGVAGRMVDTLCGIHGNSRSTPYKFVHQIPLVVDCDNSLDTQSEGNEDEGEEESTLLHNQSTTSPQTKGILHPTGSHLEQTFMATTHAKFYTAINTVSVAPCIVGKSNMFRRSHLNALTSLRNPTISSLAPTPSPPQTGISFFSHNICEDHLIGDLLWRLPLPSEREKGEKWGKHAIVWGDMAVQPMDDNMTVKQYIARRVRWLRVRKWTVTLATLIEPGVESILCSLIGAYGFTSHPSIFVPNTWTAFATFWVLSMLAWCINDYNVSHILHAFSTIERNSATPSFTKKRERGVGEWLGAWIGREILALPIWVWAVLGGGSVEWRGRRFWVGMDMRVREIDGGRGGGRTTPEVEGGKDRVD